MGPDQLGSGVKPLHIVYGGSMQGKPEDQRQKMKLFKSMEKNRSLAQLEPVSESAWRQRFRNASARILPPVKRKTA